MLFKQVRLRDFVNFDEELAEELDAEKLEENKEMTEQEIESLQSILNEKELLVVPIDEAADHLKDEDWQDIVKSKGINFLLKLSLLPKIEDDTNKFVFSDKRMDNDVPVNALPAIELWLALPAGYPSHQRPLFMQATRFYDDHFPLG